MVILSVASSSESRLKQIWREAGYTAHRGYISRAGGQVREPIEPYTHIKIPLTGSIGFFMDNNRMTVQVGEAAYLAPNELCEWSPEGTPTIYLTVKDVGVARLTLELSETTLAKV